MGLGVGQRRSAGAAGHPMPVLLIEPSPKSRLLSVNVSAGEALLGALRHALAPERSKMISSDLSVKLAAFVARVTFAPTTDWWHSIISSAQAARPS